MNRTDIIRAERLRLCVSKIPKFISGGTQSTTMASISSYAQDIAKFQNWLVQYQYFVLIEANWKNHKSDDFIFDDEFPDFISPDIMLERLEEWIKKRQSVICAASRYPLKIGGYFLYQIPPNS